jgi:CheY-like chemotaxis protein
VRDAGPGIAPEDQTGIFDEFLQLNNHSRERTQGIGLGLSIAKRLTHLMQGSITVRSALGKGTCMTVCMPQASVRIEQSHNALATSLQAPLPYHYVQHTENADASSKRRVLLVEDDVLVGGAMSDLLRSWGMQVQWVQTVEAAHEHVASLDIAICDVRLPGASSGLDFAIALKYQGKLVLLVTGETDAMTKSKAELHGIELLVKPIASAELHRALANLQTPSMQC